jgi:hypothetical protein
MANSARSTTTGQPAKPGAGPNPEFQPASLSDLITYVMERDGYRKLMPMANRGRTPYKTLYSWWTGQRGTSKDRGHGGGRAITIESLRIFAEDYNLPLPLVLHAAGRATEPLEFGEEDLQVLHLYKELPPEDQELAEQMLRNLAERARSRKTTRS